MITALRREGADPVRKKGRPWSLPMEDRVLLVVHEPAQPTTHFDPPLPRLLDGADEDEIAINVGLGLVARDRRGRPRPEAS